MPDPLIGLLDPTRILFDLQQGNEIAQCFSGCLEPEEIARRVTDGLVEKFDCAFARLWLLEPDRTTLKLVASSGMYTHTDGSFARVPMGAYKVGKIAQNRVSFLSNNLAAESWVVNREWAKANNIRGFAGYPLAIKDRVIGVLATFSHYAMEPEFLEVLQTLCTIVTIALDTALQHQKEKQNWLSSTRSPTFNHLTLSDQLVTVLSSTRLTLVGTEQPLTLPVAYVFLQAAEILNKIECAYCRLVYTEDSVGLEAIVPITNLTSRNPKNWIESILGKLFFTVSCLGGVLQTQPSVNQRTIQVVLKVPYVREQLGEQLQIQCRLPLLQQAFTHLAFLAGLRVCNGTDEDIPLLTDDITQIQAAKRVLWIQQGTQALPKGIKAKVDLSISPDQLRQAVEAVNCGKIWRIEPDTEVQPVLSERELEILALLTKGLRDRDIADRLIISESTVKFHMNNVLKKLKAQTRYQALHQAIVNGLIQ
jgi:DNA-binding CsgD family transcriptional regulator